MQFRLHRYLKAFKFPTQFARMAELADAPDLGSGAREGVGVRVSLLVHICPDIMIRAFCF